MTFVAKGLPERSAIDTVESRLDIYVGDIQHAVEFTMKL